MSLVQIGEAAPLLNSKLDAVLADGAIDQIRLSKYLADGKWVVLFFYPLAFTFVCPSEIVAFSDAVADFDAANAQVVGCAVDSVYSTLAWRGVARTAGGIGEVAFPIVSDLTQEIGKAYNCLLKSGHHSRCTVIIDPTGVVRHISYNEPSVGRNTDEFLRLVKGYQYTDANGVVCPANWHNGDKTIIPDPEKKLEFFGNQ